MSGKSRHGIARRIVAFMGLLLLGAAFAIQLPGVQTRLAAVVLERLHGMFHGKVTAGSVKIQPNGSITLNDVLVIDDNPYTEDINDCGWARVDTVAYIRSLNATVRLGTLFSKDGIRIGRASIDGGLLHLTAEPGPRGNGNLQRIFNLVPDPSKPRKTPTDTPPILSIGKIRIKDFRFRMNNFLTKIHYSGYGVDWGDMDITASVLNGHNFRIDGTVMSGVCDHAALSEKCGLQISHLSGKARAGMGKVTVENFKLQDELTDLTFSTFLMLFNDSHDFLDYVNKVRMVGVFEPSKIAMETIAYFGGKSLKGNGIVFDLSKGHFDGTVADFTIDNMVFRDLTSGVSGSLDGRCTGLPDAVHFKVAAQMHDFRFTTSQLSTFISDWAGSKVNLSSIAKGKHFTLNARTDGEVNNLHVKGLLASAMGNVALDCRLKDVVDLTRAPGVGGSLSSESLDLGQVLGIPELGSASFSTSLFGSFPKGSTEADIDSLLVRSVVFKGYEYHDIMAKGSLHDGRLDATISSADANCELDAAASLDLKKDDDGSRYQATVDIRKADLAAMKLLTTREKAVVSAMLDADVRMNPDAFMEGRLTMDKLSYADLSEKKDFSQIRLDASQKGAMQSYEISSNLLQASYLADCQPGTIIKKLKSLTLERELDALCKSEPQPVDSCQCELRLSVGEINKLLGVIRPGLYMEKGTSLSVSTDRNDRISAKLLSGRIAMGPNFLKGLNLSLDNAEEKLSAKLGIAEIKAGAYTFANPMLLADASGNHVNAALNFDDGTELGRVAKLNLMADLFKEDDGMLGIRLTTKESFMKYSGRRWDFAPCTVEKTRDGISVKGFRFSHDDQELLLEGGFSNTVEDTLFLKVNALNLALVDTFLKDPYNIKGIASGSARILSRKEKGTAMLMNMQMDSLSVGNTDAGSINMRSLWDTDRDRISIMLRNVVGDHEAMQIRGHYTPESNRLFADAKFDSLALSILSPFMRDIMTETGGNLSGNVRVEGKMDSLAISSHGMRLDDAMIRLAYTGVPYTISGPMDITNGGIFFDKIQIKDDNIGTATLKGSLKHENLKNMRLDATLDFDKLRVIDTPDTGKESFYGTLSASGHASVKGPFNALSIDARVRTDGDGQVHVPLSGSLSSSSGKLLTYTEHKEFIDPYELILEEYLKKKGTRASDLRIKAHVDITPEVVAFMEIDKSAGNIINFNGSGQVNIELRPSTSLFNLNGDYDILSGMYHFVLPGIMSKDLEIRNGSSVAFGGDLMDTRINLTATNTIRTSLSNLLSDSEAGDVRRNVVCGLTISDKLRNPKINFFIDIPDLDPALKSEVQGNLNTEDKVQKQFVALLLMGSFLPNELSGVFNGTNMIYSNLMEVVSSQMSNILKKLDIPLDFGFKYQENRSGNNVFDVAMSTQLFNNRVLVSGSLGNRQFKTSSTATNDVIGDIDIQVKLDKLGRYNITLFSHSADERTNFLDYSQRNGIGFSFQKDFKARKKRKMNEDKEEVIIKIDDESGKTVSDTLASGRKRSKRGNTGVRARKGMQP